MDVRGQCARGVERGKRIRSRVADAVANELVGRKDAPLAVFAAFSRVSSARRSMARAVWWTALTEVRLFYSGDAALKETAPRARASP